MGLRIKIWLLSCLLALLLTGCGLVTRTSPDPLPQKKKPAPEETEPQVELLQEPAPAPEPDLMPGPAVTVDGMELPGGSVRNGDVLYVRLQELVQALGTELSWNEASGGGSFLWKEEPVCLAQRAASFRWGGRFYDLGETLLTAGGEVWVPVTALCRELGMGILEDPEEQHLYITPAAGSWTVPEGYRVPILMYHGVTDETWGFAELFVSPADMEAQLQYLADNGYETIWFSDLARIDEIEKPVLLTFDDGYGDNYAELFPLLEKYRAKATIFVVTASVDNNPRSLTAEQIREMAASGLVDFQSHTVTHPYLGSLTPEMQEQELCGSRLALTRLTGRIPYVLCYPSGHFNQTTVELTRKYYSFGVNMSGGTYTTAPDPYRISRWYVPRDTGLAVFAAMLE